MQTTYADAFGGDYSEYLDSHYNNFIDKVEDFVWSGELEGCINNVEKWESLGFSVKKSSYGHSLDNAWMEIVTDKFTYEKDVTRYNSTEKKTETKPFVFTARLNSDATRCISLKAQYRDVWGTPIKLYQMEENDEGITPRQTKKLVNDFIKNNTQKSVNKLLFDDED